MKIVGIIAEYNPFHNGHLYHLINSRKKAEADYSIAVMSGNFLQRGEPALYDKWTRAEIAVKNGVDLVIELPFAFACNNADYFAKGALGILNGLGCVTHFSFGSEAGDLRGLMDVAALFADESSLLGEYIKEEMAKGVSFPTARCSALGRYAGEMSAGLTRDPNNILGIEYLKQWILTKSRITPITITRFGPRYGEKKWIGPIASATAIRQKIITVGGSIEDVIQVIPPETFKTIKTRMDLKPIGLEDLYTLILYKILTTQSSELEKIFSMAEGLENRLIRCAKKSADMKSLIKAIKTKRYTETRIQRVLIHVLLNLTAERMERFAATDCLYARVLALSEKGGEILNYIKKQDCATIPILTNINKEVKNHPQVQPLLNLDIMASDVYNLACGAALYKNSDQVAKLHINRKNHLEDYEKSIENFSI